MRQIINRGQSPGDPNGESLYSGTGKINQNFEELYSKFNGFLTSLNIIRNGNVFKVPANRQWVIAGVQYTNASDFFFTIPNAATGYKRYDLLVVRATGFEVVSGTPATGVAQIPDIPNAQSAILASPYYVDGNNVGDGTEPGAGSNYITKISRRDALYGFTGANVLLPSPNAYNGYRLVGTGLVSVDGFLYDSLNPPTLGDLFPITNVTGGNVTLNNSASFITGNAVLANNKVVLFRYEGGGIYRIVAGSLNLTLQEVTAAGSTTTIPIVVNIANSANNGISTNANIAGRIFQFGNNAIIGPTSPAAGSSLTVDTKLIYANSVGATFTGREHPDVNFNNATYAKLSGQNIFAKDNNANTSNSIMILEGATNPNLQLRLNLDTSNNLAEIQAIHSGVTYLRLFLQQEGGDVVVGQDIGGSEKLRVAGPSRFHSTVMLGKFTNGTEPAHEQGKTYFNTSIGKMKIGGATGWEIISST